MLSPAVALTCEMMMTTRGKTASNDAYAQLQPEGSAQVFVVFEDESRGMPWPYCLICLCPR
jgi:hypothetical protein